jgi:hypothetical protein
VTGLLLILGVLVVSGLLGFLAGSLEAVWRERDGK